jgi:hypothetical protein
MAALAGLTALFVVAHVLLLHLPMINWEYAFSEGARYFSDGDLEHLQQYFGHEANTLAVPWLAFAIHRLLPALDIDYAPRLVSSLGIPLLAWGLLRINRQLTEKANPYLLISIVLLNPLVWTYSGRGTADFLPAAVGVFALSLYWGGDEKKGLNLLPVAAASAVLGIAAVVKYHALLLLGGVVAEIAIRRAGNYRIILLEWTVATVPALVLLSAYLVAVKTEFGFWLTPPQFQQMLGLDIAAEPDNLLSYAGYLTLITAPLSLTIPWPRAVEFRSQYAAGILLLVVAFLLGYFFLADNGEMNLGPLDRYVNKSAANGVLAAFSALLPICLVMGVSRSGFAAKAATIKLGLAATIVLFILALSPTRPAQRYLLSVVPLYYFFFLAPQKHHRATIAATLLFSVTLDVYILLNQAASGIASEKMVQRIAELGLLSSTDPGPIEANVGDRFFPYRNEQKVFAVVAGDVDGRIAEVHYSAIPRVPFIGKSYSLVRLPSR